MIEKTILYANEQFEIVNKIVKILNLDTKRFLVLYEMDQDEEMQNKIMELIPDIKKYFRYDKIKGVRYTDITKRAYFSIIKSIIKNYYDIRIVSYAKKNEEDNSVIYSKKYYFTPKNK
jgi:hypothetical protein